jgi:hypothetical protein
MTPIEAARISAAIAVIRPDWPERSIRTLLADPPLSQRIFRDVLVALAYVAADPQTHTPGRILHAGPWWQIGNPEPEPTRAIRCPDCHAAHMPTEDHQCRRPSSRTAAHTDRMRAALSAATAGLCPHGPGCRDCQEVRAR